MLRIMFLAKTAQHGKKVIVHQLISLVSIISTPEHKNTFVSLKELLLSLSLGHA